MVALKVPDTGLVYLDANCLIYHVERVAPFDAALGPLMSQAAAGRIVLVTSELTLLECLVKPLREGNERSASLFRAVLTESRELRMLPMTRSIVERAAMLRAAHALRTPDALHAATAIEAAAGLLVSADPVFRQVPGLNVDVLEA